MGHRQKVDKHQKAELQRLDDIADLLDSWFRIPGTNLRFGLDGLLGLMPGLGDGVTALPAVYIIYRAKRLGAPQWVLTRMGLNLLLDLAIGSIPLIGDLFDFGFKANRRNIALLKRHFQP